MRLLHYIEIENFKRFGEKQRIKLDHPAVLIGPHNCGKTSPHISHLPAARPIWR